jgi:hypothetical protein
MIFYYNNNFVSFVSKLCSLSEYSDENMMDPYNLAICFGPTLVPVPEDKDQVQYQNLVNELIKNVIINSEDIFPNDGGLLYERYISKEPDEGYIFISLSSFRMCFCFIYLFNCFICTTGKLVKRRLIRCQRKSTRKSTHLKMVLCQSISRHFSF